MTGWISIMQRRDPIVSRERKERGREEIFSLHLSRLYLPHSVTPTRESDKDAIAHEIVNLLHSLVHRTLVILTSFLPCPRDLLALLLRELIVVKVRIHDARREHAMDMR